MKPALEINDVSKRFGKKVAVDRVSLEVAEGELHALLGQSGCGKTTLLRLIAGFEKPDGGKVKLHGDCVTCEECWVPPQKRRVGMVFQAYHLFPHMTVAQNVRYGLDGQGQADRVAEVLELVGLSSHANRSPDTLSGGEQQRVALARALAPSPQILLLDEPFSSLDEQLRIELRARVKQILREAGVTTLLVTHHQEEALGMADRVSVIENGSILQTASPATLYLRPASRKVATFIGESNLVPGRAAGRVAMTELGPLAIDQNRNGRVDVLLRPESIEPRLLDNGAGTADSPLEAEVVGTQFLGRERLLRLRHRSGTPLLARVGAEWPGNVGSKVEMRIRGVLCAFEAE